jgi:hypothetical protein
MIPTKFEILTHSIHPDRQAIEVTYDGRLIATITQSPSEPQFCILTKHPTTVGNMSPGAPGMPRVIVVDIQPNAN